MELDEALAEKIGKYLNIELDNYVFALVACPGENLLGKEQFITVSNVLDVMAVQALLGAALNAIVKDENPKFVEVLCRDTH